MKKPVIILFLSFLFIFYSCLVQKTGRKALYDLQQMPVHDARTDSLFILDAGTPENGDAEAGYKYLVEGNAFSSGIPIEIYKPANKILNSQWARLAGYNKYASNDLVLFKNNNGQITATPGCLQCHAQQFNNELIIGLGNSYSSFQTNTAPYLKLVEEIMRLKYGKNSNEWKTAEKAFASGRILQNRIRTQVQGPAPAQKIAEVMASHCDPVTLKFRADTVYFFTPDIVIPEDVPALWFAKKKKVFAINAMRQGSILKHITTTSILTLNDTTEAREIYKHAKDVWAYIKTLKPPKYSFAINQNLADKGKQIFLQTCSRCHGTYDIEGDYPDKLVPADIIGTDSLLWKYFIKYPEYTEWFNKSWFAVSESPAVTKPQRGYVAPPLEGVWITAPYLHNGSVPTIDEVLNSKARPRYWKRNFNKEEYDYGKLGWRYKKLSNPRGKKTYNTDIPGYGNYGHTFGDHLTMEERKAVIEYLKTL